MERYFGMTAQARIVSLGTYEANDPRLDAKLTKVAIEKTGESDGMFLTLNEVYRLIETGKEALNTP